MQKRLNTFIERKKMVEESDKAPTCLNDTRLGHC